MKILAIGDGLIPADVMLTGLMDFKKAGAELTVRQWQHNSIEDLQKDNLEIEKNGTEIFEVSEDLIYDISEYVMLIVQFFPVNSRVIKRGTKLKYIGVLRGGTENITRSAAEELNIEVINTPGRNARAVAEFTLGMILCEIRNIARSHAALKNNNQWRKDFPNKSAIPEIYGKIIGIVGFGNIARLLSGYLEAMGAHILFYDPFVSDSIGNAEKVDLTELLKAADIVSLNLRLTEETHHLIAEKELALLKPSAVLINTSRSGVIDEQALVSALKKKMIAGAALDVFDNEPLQDDDPLRQLDNVTITNHLAGSTIDAFKGSPGLFAERFMNSHSEWS